MLNPDQLRLAMGSYQSNGMDPNTAVEVAPGPHRILIPGNFPVGSEIFARPRSLDTPLPILIANLRLWAHLFESDRR